MNNIEFKLQKLQTLLRQHILKQVKDQWLADDILQETLLIAVQKQSTLQDQSKLLPWCKTIARNLYFRHLQKKHSEEEFKEASILTDEVFDQTENLYQNQKTRIILQLLNQLPEKQKYPAIDYYLNGIPRKDICRKYNISESVFDSRLLRARNKIKSYLLRRHKTQKDIDFINRFNELIKGEYSMDDFRIEISQNLVPELIQQDDNIIGFIKSHRNRMAEDFNITLPRVHIKDNEHLKGNEYIILLQEKRISEGEIAGTNKLRDMTQVISGVITKHFL